MSSLPLKKVLPKSGALHPLFGTRLLNVHNFRDPRWQPTDKIDQYYGLTRLYIANKHMKNITSKSIEKELEKKLFDLQKELIASRDILKKALYGDIDRIKSIFMDYKELRRSYQSMPVLQIVESLDNKTFVKRKELDRLINERHRITEAYKTVLLQLAKFQDRVKYIDEKDISEDIMVRDIQVELQNSEIRMRTLRIVNETYRKIIDNLAHDAHYFEPTLKALEDDSAEQTELINHALKLGIPALKTLRNLTQTYIEIEKRDIEDSRVFGLDISTNRQKITANHENKKYIRDDVSLMIFLLQSLIIKLCESFYRMILSWIHLVIIETLQIWFG